MFGEEAFGVELDAFERPGFVADAHDFFLIGPTADLVFGGRVPLWMMRAVVAGGGEGVGHAGVEGFAVVVDLIGFAGIKRAARYLRRSRSRCIGGPGRRPARGVLGRNGG